MQQEYHAAGERSVSSTAHRVRSKTDKYAVIRILSKYFTYGVIFPYVKIFHHSTHISIGGTYTA